MNDDLDLGRFYGVAAITARWGVSQKTVWRKIRSGELRARKIGRGWAVHGTAIRDYEAGTDFGPISGAGP
jgi:Helix-turn-helix domain